MRVRWRCPRGALYAVALAVAAVWPRAFPQAPAEAYWPAAGWRTSTPEAQGLDSAILADAFDYVRAHRTRIHSLAIVRNGYLVLDATFFPFQQNQLHDVASVTKSITTTLIGVAIGDRKLRDVKQPVLQVFPDRTVRNRDDRKERLTLEHLLTMTSGLDCHYSGGESTLREMRTSPDWVQFMLDRPMIAEPGTKGEYCSGGMHVLSGVISTAARMSAFAYARAHLFKQLGIVDAIWPADPKGVTHGWGDLHLKPLDMARIGYFWLNQGRWKQQIVPQSWMASAVQPYARVINGDYGYGLWVNRTGDPIVYEANGRGGQRITVLPTKNMVIAITGGAFEPGEIGAFIVKSLRSDRALPENPTATRRLTAAVAAARQPIAESVAPASPLAQQISGKRYVLDSNPLGWRAITLNVAGRGTGIVTMEFGDRPSEKRILGLDGVPRPSPAGRFGLPVAVQGFWIDGSTFVLDYDEVANINSFVCRITFDGQTASFAVKERTGEVDLKIRATLQ